MVGRNEHQKTLRQQETIPKAIRTFEVVAKIPTSPTGSVSLKHGESTTCFTHPFSRRTKKPTNTEQTFWNQPPELIEGEEEWEIEQILGKCHFGRGKKLQYLVRWKDYSPAHDQWVDKSDITADELVEIYERENREERPPRRSIRTPRKRTNKVIPLHPPLLH